MAPLGISLVNLLIESSSLGCLAEGRQAKKEQEFAQNSSSSASSPEPSTSPSNRANHFFLGGDGVDGTTAQSTFSSTSSSSSSPFSKTSPSSSYNNNGTNLNNNNYFSGTSQSESTKKSCGGSTENNFGTGEASSATSSPTQKLYSLFWEKFKRPYDQEEVSTARPFSRVDSAEQVETKKNKGEDFKNRTDSVSFDDKTCSTFSAESAYKKFYEGAQQINSHLLPFWSLLSYPSDLHYYGRAAVMTVVTGHVIEKTLEKLPDIEQLGKRYGPYLQCNLLDGSDPNQPGKVGLDKDFF